MHKVSRRLARQLRLGLNSPQLAGNVKISVYAYIYLLARTADEGAPYTYNYFSQELVFASDAVVIPHTV